MSKSKRIVTLIGTRKPPIEFHDLMREIGLAFSNRGFIARSGGAIGCDTLFLEKYDPSLKVVYRPDDSGNGINVQRHKNYYEFELIASRFHVAWEFMRVGDQNLHARNVPQVLGLDLQTPSDLVVYCANESGNGVVSGGTATAVKIARHHNIKTINIMNPDHRKKLCDWLKIKYVPLIREIEPVDLFNL